MSATLGPAHAALGAALVRMTGAAIRGSRETLWASSGFSGCRHSFVLDLSGREDPPALARLDCAEFELPGHFVADIALVGREQRAQRRWITIEALTVEDR